LVEPILLNGNSLILSKYCQNSVLFRKNLVTPLRPMGYGGQAGYWYLVAGCWSLVPLFIAIGSWPAMIPDTGYWMLDIR
jgi:hypothetical protein